MREGSQSKSARPHPSSEPGDRGQLGTGGFVRRPTMLRPLGGSPPDVTQTTPHLETRARLGCVALIGCMLLSGPSVCRYSTPLLWYNCGMSLSVVYLAACSLTPEMIDDHKTDAMGNCYVQRSGACVHFNRFVAFDKKHLALERWLEQCERRERAAAAVHAAHAAPGIQGNCFKCGGSGHWARDCMASDQESDTEQPLDKSPKAHALTATVSKKTTKATVVRKPRVLLKNPPSWQWSAKAAFSSARTLPCGNRGGGREDVKRSTHLRTDGGTARDLDEST